MQPVALGFKRIVSQSLAHFIHYRVHLASQTSNRSTTTIRSHSFEMIEKPDKRLQSGVFGRFLEKKLPTLSCTFLFFLFLAPAVSCFGTYTRLLRGFGSLMLDKNRGRYESYDSVV
ncbi:hypothetical protein BH10PSE11_BH10PSE11_13410 [soil metagenome]